MAAEGEQIRTGRKTGRGFTLLEVLGAVAVLGIWYFVLAAWATDGLIREGQSLRKMRAGMIADRTLAELEAMSLEGSVPELMDEVMEPDEASGELYAVRKQVTAFTMDFGTGKTNEQRGKELESAPLDTSLPLPSFIGQNIPGFARHLYQINVIVTWSEGFMDEQAVFRTTYVFDMASAAEVYQSEEMQAREDEEDEGSEEDEFAGEEQEENFEEGE